VTDHPRAGEPAADDAAIGRHDVALIAMERRGVDVLWALLPDNRPFQTKPPVPPTA
jgi:hypothetical protein